MNKKRLAYTCLLLLLINLIAYALASCVTPERKMPSYVKHGIARDTLHTIDYRGNGAVIIWLTHAEEGYCFSDPGKIDQAEDLLLNHNGEVIIDYESQVSLAEATPSPYDPQRLCANTEVSSTTVYIGRSLKKVPGRYGHSD